MLSPRARLATALARPEMIASARPKTDWPVRFTANLEDDDELIAPAPRRPKSATR